MDYWHNVIDKGKLKYSQKDLPQRHFIHYKFHVDCLCKSACDSSVDV